VEHRVQHPSATLDAPPFAAPPPHLGRARLGGLARVDAHGPDAREFLHGQLSSDVKALALGAGQYASYNSPKGRMLATLIVWRRDADRYSLVVAADLAEAFARRLAMFVLRAKVKLAADAPTLWGIVGDATALRAAGEALQPHAAPWTSWTLDGAALIALPDGRRLVDVAGALPDPLAALPVVDEALWRWCGIRAGVAQVTRATSDTLIAQSANFELVGGVDFAKGCYPGQEIIARMQYLGRLKERLRGFHATAEAAAVAAGTPLRADGRDEAMGVVVDAAPAPGGGSDLLAVVREEALDAPLRAASFALAPRALPYAVPALVNARARL
jgi:tRNA-modifying protein YgfZ